MNAIFIETSGFAAARDVYLSDTVYAQLQQDLMDNPQAGEVIPGCGGLRKVRVGDSRRGKGKRSGARVIYLHVPLAHHFYLIEIYGRDEKENLTATDKRLFAKIVASIKAAANVRGKTQSPERRHD